MQILTPKGDPAANKLRVRTKKAETEVACMVKMLEMGERDCKRMAESKRVVRMLFFSL